ncbi:hypothetical protein [Stieleria sp.]|uniref:Uncharacterized protein n=1 Tax=Stieleria magnilauensis TaxID=2527963 RepID=A0ABX5XPF3_9BACT|nr:hypothetical protein TBK1r_28230 [Planctomycetes bacterium TBK1r]
MSRRRTNSNEDDSLELLLDTVSNVFGGVMFLTLLAALLIIARGTAPAEPDDAVEERPVPVSAVLVEAKIRQTAAAIQAQQEIMRQLDPDGDVMAKSDRLRSLEQTLSLARRHAGRTDHLKEAQQQALRDQLANQSELEQQIADVKQQIADQAATASAIRTQSERSVEFRPLSRSMTDEAVVLLRYGRWYLLQTGPSEGVNRDDFFVLQHSRSLTRVTPKPHRGSPVTSQSLSDLVTRLKAEFKPGQFHVLIAVWDDSFSEFNPVKDAVKAAGYTYRTLPCDSSTRLSNQYAAEAYVQ